MMNDEVCDPAVNIHHSMSLVQYLVCLLAATPSSVLVRES